MIHIGPRRFAGMLDNALAAAKQGTKPFPHIMILALDGALTVSGVGQHVMVEDTEQGMGGPEDGVALRVKEAEAVAKTVRSTEGALKRDTTVYLTIDDGVLRVENGAETIIEVADVGDEADGAWAIRADSQHYYGEPVARADRYDLFDTSVLAVIGKLKPDSVESRVLLYPRHAGDTAMFRVGSVRGFVEGNRTPPENVDGVKSLF